MSAPRRPVRIANCSGFYGDRLAAAREMVEGGPIDVLTGDYLAELTMMILWKLRRRDPAKGYATTFLTQLEHVLGTCVDRGIKVVSNAGGLNPSGLAGEVRALADRLGLAVRVAHVDGDDLADRLGALQAAGHLMAHLDTGRPLADLDRPVVTANAYLGGWGIAEALDGGADVVVCPRVTDASLVVGPAAWWHGWERDDWDRLAGAVAAGHVVECGAQVTGGNYSFFRELAQPVRPGFPIAEVAADGSSVVTKHPGTGGAVTIGTVTAQLLYEIDAPAYPNPDVVARFDTVQLDQDGPDRVRISGVRGEPAPSDLKVCVTYEGGYRNEVVFVLTGLDVEAKADLALRGLLDALGEVEAFDSLDVRLVRSDRPGASTAAEASAYLHVAAKSSDAAVVGRRFSGAAVELALASYPGFFLVAPPADATPFGVFWPACLPASLVPHAVVHHDGRRVDVPPVAGGRPAPPVEREVQAVARVPGGPTRQAPLGAVAGARSGDKGGNANVGVWCRSGEAYAWLAETLTVERFRELLPEAEGLAVRRWELPNVLALNFVVVGLLGEGVAASTRHDPQAKGLGELLRSRPIDVPTALLDV